MQMQRVLLKFEVKGTSSKPSGACAFAHSLWRSPGSSEGFVYLGSLIKTGGAEWDITA